MPKDFLPGAFYRPTMTRNEVVHVLPVTECGQGKAGLPKRASIVVTQGTARRRRGVVRRSGDHG